MTHTDILKLIAQHKITNKVILRNLNLKQIAECQAIYAKNLDLYIHIDPNVNSLKQYDNVKTSGLVMQSVVHSAPTAELNLNFL